MKGEKRVEREREARRSGQAIWTIRRTLSVDNKVHKLKIVFTTRRI